MNVLIIVPDSIKQPFGGMGIFANNLKNCLEKYQDINTLIFSSDGGVSKEQTYDFLQVTHLAGANEGIVKNLLGQCSIVGSIVRTGFIPDIIHCCDWSTSWAGLVLSKLYNCKLIYHVHLSFRNALTYIPDGHAELAVRAIEDAELTVLNQADIILQVSHYYSKMYPKWFLPKTAILHNGVNLQEWDHTSKTVLPGNRKYKAVYIGRYAAMKNIDTLLQAKIPDNMDLIFVGSETGGDVQIFNRMIEQVKSRSELHHIGPKHDEEKIAVMQSADFIIVPSSHEPFGIVALEAMAAKTQLICSMQDGLSEFANHPFVINCGITSESISAALEQASKMTQEQININTDKAFEHVKNWTWEKQSEKLAQIYRFLTHERVRNNPEK